MKMLSEQVLNKFKSIKSYKVDMSEGDARKEVDIMTETNIRTARRRNDRRTDDVVAQHTQQGYGAELTLRSIEEATPSAGISPYFKGLTYAKVMSDFYCEDIPCQMKTVIGTTLDRNRKWYISESQFKSILESHSYYENIFLFKAERVKPYVYTYGSFLMIDSSKFMLHLKPNKGTVVYSPYYFDYVEALMKGTAIAL